MSESPFFSDSDHHSLHFLVSVCLAVLYMSKRDERRARRTLLANAPVDADGVSEELEDVDSKSKVSVDRLSVK